MYAFALFVFIVLTFVILITFAAKADNPDPYNPLLERLGGVAPPIEMQELQDIESSNAELSPRTGFAGIGQESTDDTSQDSGSRSDEKRGDEAHVDVTEDPVVTTEESEDLQVWYPIHAPTFLRFLLTEHAVTSFFFKTKPTFGYVARLCVLYTTICLEMMVLGVVFFERWDLFSDSPSEWFFQCLVVNASVIPVALALTGIFWWQEFTGLAVTGMGFLI
jgi:hypothetical protein